jgi:hypothetical protein
VADHISLSAKLALPNGVALTVADAAEHPASYTSSDVVTNRIREIVKKVSLLTIAKDDK